MATLTKAKFLDSINLRVPSNTIFKSPSNEEVFKALYQMVYQSKLKGIADFKKEKLMVVWKFVCHYLIRCLSGRTSDTNSMGKQFLDLILSIFTAEPMDFGSILWDDFLTYVGRNEPRTGLTEVTSARFSSL